MEIQWCRTLARFEVVFAVPLLLRRALFPHAGQQGGNSVLLPKANGVFALAGVVHFHAAGCSPGL